MTISMLVKNLKREDYKMASKSDIVKSLKAQGLVDDPESWMKLAALVACVVNSSKSLAVAVESCYKKIK